MEVDSKSNDQIPESLTENSVDVSSSQDGGVRKVILREGTGDEKPGIGNEVVVHYTGTLVDGTKFDSSRDRNDKFKFKLGQGQVIKAWDQGVATMKRGELCRLICSSDYAYGKSGSPPTIPPDATLIFEVELFDWKGEDLSEDSDGGILRSTLVAGSGYQSPNEGAQVKLELSGSFEGRVFDDRTVSYSVGDAGDHGVPDGVDVAIRKFKKGEKSVLTLLPQYAFGCEGSSDYNIPGGATVKYTVTLVEMEKAKESWEMDAAEKLSQSELAKAKGTALFKNGQFQKALKKYKLIAKWLDDDLDFSDEQGVQRTALRLAAHLNSALCHLKQEDWARAREECNNALEFDGNSEKALFRRGQSYVGTKDYEEAKQDFAAVLEVDPDNKAAKNQRIICDQKLKQEKEREKKMYANMFSKFSSQQDSDQKNTTVESVSG